MTARSAACFVVLGLLLGACSSIHGERAFAAYMQTSTSGDVSLGPTGGGVALDTRQNDFERSLGLDETKPALNFGGDMATDIGRFGASVLWFDSSGSGTLTRDFGDIPSGTLVNSKFRFFDAKTWWVYDVVERPGFRLAPGVAVDFFNMSVNAITAASPQVFEEVHVFAPVPMLFLDAEASVDKFTFVGQAGGMRIDLKDGIGNYWDLEGRVNYAVSDDIAVFAGYRFMSMASHGDADSRDAFVHVQTTGWFLGGELSF